ncbi:SdrD B-like domain-containing protein [Psychromicrobium xiongbiense]|uniref:SdrD B-like domain-containing protein n=1 Tax=Psychromicrobium xiongbiense TaxID=3051184 RepID=UPI002554A375|nr:SdrD B-like domain-containing protein [Psychromicrobium sp. YIM S02556]
MLRRRLRQTLAAVLSMALALSALIAFQVVNASVSEAATQNGYVFNDAWQLTNAGSAATQYTDSSQSSYATNSATSSIPLRTGAVKLAAQFALDSSQIAGTSSLTNGSNQGAYGATSNTFIGSPTPSQLPALGVVTNASKCNGPMGSAAHQNFDGICSPVGTLTLTFSQPVTDPVMDISGLGGWSFQYVNGYARGSFNNTHWTLLTPGVSFTALSAGHTDLAITSTTLGAVSRNTSTHCDTPDKNYAGTDYESPNAELAGCGSVILKGTFSTLKFQVDTQATPFSDFPTAQYSTGKAYFGSDNSGYADGINGYNMVQTEKGLLPGSPNDSTNSDLQRISFRLPQNGVLGDKVWQDTNGDGIQDPNEPGVQGVTVQLLDANGNPVKDANGNPITATTDANGNYKFTDLPLGQYKVKFTNLPAGQGFTTPQAGSDPSKNSSADPTTGESPVVSLTSDQPQDLNVDAGLVPQGSIGDRVWYDDNANGIQDGSEAGIPNVTVALLDKDGNPVKDANGNPVTTTTDSNGNYSFKNLPLGTYRVKVQLPSGGKFSPEHQGSDATVDSDVDSTGLSDPVTLDAANPNNTTVDAGVVFRGALGDHVWLDQNGNGIQDSGEPGIQGVKAELLDENGNPVKDANGNPITTTTDANGDYHFTDLPLGKYKVRFSGLKDGLTWTQKGAGSDPAKDSNVDPANGTTDVVTLTGPNPVDNTVDAGAIVNGSLGDKVWLDQNGDGIQDPNEPGVSGVTVHLLDGNGNPVKDANGNPVTTTTDSNGNYLFPNLPAGNYRVKVDIPSGMKATVQGAGSDPSKDSNIDSSGLSDVVTIDANNPNRRDVDAGLVVNGSLGDKVWLDQNGDGIQDPNEPGVSGVTVHLLDGNGNPVKDANGNPVTTTTDSNGNYLFPNLPAGNYRVKVDIPSGMKATVQGAGSDPSKDSNIDSSGLSDVVTIDANNPNRRDVDAGLVVNGSLGDKVWLDQNGDGIQDPNEPGVSGVTVHLLDGNGNPVKDANGNPVTTTTDSNGNYLFPNLPAGTYKVKVDLPAGFKATTENAGSDPAKDSDIDANGLSNAVTIDQNTPNRTDVDAGLVVNGSIGDKVWLDQNGDGVQDPNEPGISGVTVHLLDGNGNPVKDANGNPVTTTTDSNGNYLFPNLPAGTYEVKVDYPDGFKATTQNAGSDPAKDSDIDATGKTGPITVDSKTPVHTDVDAGLVVNGSIGDKVWLDQNGDGIQDPNEPGVSGVTVHLLDKDGNPVKDANGNPVTTTTDANGNYLFPNLPAGDYRVKVDLPAGRKFTQQAAGSDRDKDSNVDASGLSDVVSIDAANPNRRDVDAGLVVNGSIGDKVWLDQNGDGIQDPNEPGVSGVTVHLLDKDGNPVKDANGNPVTTTTDANGNYLFPNLPAGTYKVKVDLPADRKFTQEGAGNDPAKDSDVDGNGVSAPVVIDAANSDRRDVDAGLVMVGTIGDKVWRDDNGDGIQDPNEPGVPGVSVKLLDKNGNVVAETTTDQNGNYQFTDVPLGDYTVQVVPPAGATLSPEGQGSDPARDSDFNAAGHSRTITVDADHLHQNDVDAGLVYRGSIGDRVWLDQNGNGIQDPNEPGVPGVTIHLLDKDGNPVKDANGNPITTTTDADGNYRFTGLPVGDYRIKVDLPAGYSASQVRAGSDPNVDSDIDPNGLSGVISLVPGAMDVHHVDAGLVPIPAPAAAAPAPSGDLPDTGANIEWGALALGLLLIVLGVFMVIQRRVMKRR